VTRTPLAKNATTSFRPRVGRNITRDAALLVHFTLAALWALYFFGAADFPYRGINAVLGPSPSHALKTFAHIMAWACLVGGATAWVLVGRSIVRAAPFAKRPVMILGSEIGVRYWVLPIVCFVIVSSASFGILKLVLRTASL